jgi:hypothetical protein
MVGLYLLVLWQARLKASGWGDPFAFNHVQWSEPVTSALLVISLITLIGVFFLGRLGLHLTRRSQKAGIKTAIVLGFTLIGASFLETIAIYGLTLAFAKQGTSILPVSYLMLIATPIGFITLWPLPSRWRKAAERPKEVL